MSTQPGGYMQRIRAGEPIERAGLTFFPVKVRDYEAYQACRGALLLRQSALPAPYMMMPYLAALYALDADNGFQLGLMGRLLRLLALTTGMEAETFQIVPESGDIRRLACLRYHGGAARGEITPANFTTIRQLMADQNGEELPDESENPELAAEAEEMAKEGADKLETSLDALLESVALQYRLRPRDLMDWTVRELNGAISAIWRDKRFMLCTAAEYGGMCRWPGGNPCPSWCFDAKKNTSGVLRPLSEVSQSLGLN